MIETARQRRAQQVEAKYAADLHRLRQAKEYELAQVDERHKIIKNSYRMERISIKEEYSMKRLDVTTKIDHLKDQRTILLRRIQDTTDIEELSVGETLTIQKNRIEGADSATVQGEPGGTPGHQQALYHRGRETA